MKKCKLAAMAWLSVCIVLFTSCGNSAGVSAGSTSEVKSTAVSESTAEEKQPYEILREKEDETKQIAADEEQQVKELQDALNAVNFYYEEFDGGDALMGVSPNCENNEKQGKSCIIPVIYVFGPSVDPIACIGFDYIGDTYLDMDTVEIDTDNYRYTYGNTTFITDVQKALPQKPPLALPSALSALLQGSLKFFSAFLSPPIHDSTSVYEISASAFARTFSLAFRYR